MVEHIKGEFSILLFLIFFLSGCQLPAQTESIYYSDGSYTLYNNGIFVYNDYTTEKDFWFYYSMGIWKQNSHDTYILKSYNEYKSEILSVREYRDSSSEDCIIELFDRNGSLLSIDQFRCDTCFDEVIFSYKCDTCFLMGSFFDRYNQRCITIELPYKPISYRIQKIEANHFVFVIRDACRKDAIYIEEKCTLQNGHLICVPLKESLE